MLSLVHRAGTRVGRLNKALPRLAIALTPASPLRGESVGRGYFSGTYLNAVDAKHRLSVPAGIRETVESRSGESCVVLAPHEHAPCLVGYDTAYFDTLHAQLNERHAGDYGPDRAHTARTLFAMADRFTYDKTGRIVLTPLLRDLGEIGATALIMGVGDQFEIWAPEAFMAYPGTDPRLVRMAKALMAQKAAG